MNAHSMPQSGAPANPSVIEAVEFLKAFDPDGRHNLVAFDPDGGPVGGLTIEPGQWDRAEAFVAAHNGRHNLYFSVNEPRAGAPNTKLTKADIAALRAVFADADLADSGDREADRKAIRDIAVRALEPQKPTWVVDSGGGYHFYWQLETKLPPAEAERAEAQSRGIAALIDGDLRVSSIDHIMRLPGTVNIPGKKKLAKGRVAAPARLASNRGARSTLDALERLYRPLKRGETVDKSAEVSDIRAELDMTYVQGHVDYADLPEELREKLERAMRENGPLRDLWAGRKAPQDQSTSGWRFALAKILRWHGDFTATEYGALAYVWDRADPDKIDSRAIARDWANVPHADPEAHFDVIAVPNNPFAEIELNALRGDGVGNSEGVYPVVDVNTLMTREPPKMLVARHIPEQSIGFVYGDPGTLKSFLMLDIALHIAAGFPRWHGDPLEADPSAIVVYLALEGGFGVRNRIRAWCKQHGVEPADLASRFKMIEVAVNFRVADDVAKLVRTVQQSIGARPALIVVDTVSRTIPGAEENGQPDMTLFVAACDKLRQAFHCAVVGVHHAGKNGSMRGSTVLPGAGDFVFKLTREGKSPTITLECEKQKDGPDGWRDTYSSRLVDLGQGQSSLTLQRATATAEPAQPTLADLKAAAADAEQRNVAVAVLDAMSGAVKASIGDIWPAVALSLNKAGTTSSQARHVITGKVVTWLAGDGATTINAAGQTVRLCAQKEGVGPKAPWVVTAYVEPAAEPHASDTSDTSGGVLS